MEGGDWKKRLGIYEGMLKSINSTPNFDFSSIQGQIIELISDVNPNCQHIALQICQQYVTKGRQIPISQIVKVLIEKGLTNRQHNCELSLQIILSCFNDNSEIILALIYEEIQSKSLKIVLSMIQLLEDIVKQSNRVNLGEIMKNIDPLLTHKNPKVRQSALELTKTLEVPKSLPPSPKTIQGSPKASKLMSPIKFSHPMVDATDNKQKNISFNIKKSKGKILSSGSNSSSWVLWADTELLTNLESPKWQAVVEGLESIRKKYQEAESSSGAIAYGLTTVFVNRTFAPKVMNQILESILFFLKEDHDQICEETYNSTLSFFLDKVSDKRHEDCLFSIMDQIGESNSFNSVYKSLYNHLNAKNPVLPSRILSYICYTIKQYGRSFEIDQVELSENLKPLCSHADPNVRKNSLECVASLASVYGESIIDGFKSLKKVQLDEIRKSMNVQPSIIPNQNNNSKLIPPKHDSKMTEKPKRSSSEARPKSSNLLPRVVEIKKNDIFPDDLIHSIGEKYKTEEQKSIFENVELISSSILKEKGEGSSNYNQIELLFTKINPYLRDSDSYSSIMLLIVKIIKNCFEILGSAFISDIPARFLLDFVVLLNINNSILRQALNNCIIYLSKNYCNFVPSVLVKSFHLLNHDAKSLSLSIINDIPYEMNLIEFWPLITDIISDDTGFESSSMIIDKYMLLKGAEAFVKSRASQFNATIRERIIKSLCFKQSKSSKIYKLSPTSALYSQRKPTIMGLIPEFLTNPISNDFLDQIMNDYFCEFFNLELKNYDIKLSFKKIKEEIANDLSLLVYSTDLLIIWCYHISKNYDNEFEMVNIIIHLIIDYYQEINQSLDRLNLILLLGYLFNFDQKFKEFQALIESIRIMLDPRMFYDVLIFILRNSNSGIVISSCLNHITKNLGSFPQNMQSDLMNCISSIKGLQSLNINIQNSIESIKNSFINENSPSEKPVFNKCKVCDSIIQKLNTPSLIIYEWIYQISSPDSVITIQALKSITRQIDSNASYFSPHLENLLLALISKIHSSFSMEDPPFRLLKYLAFCMFSLFEKTELPKQIHYDYTKQIILELITRLCNGVEDSYASHALNMLIVKIIESCTLQSFKALLCGLNEFLNNEFSDKWGKLAIKCFEPCRDQIYDNHNTEEIIESFNAVESFLNTHSPKAMKESQIGSRIFQAISKYCIFINQINPDLIQKYEAKNGSSLIKQMLV